MNDDELRGLFEAVHQSFAAVDQKFAAVHQKFEEVHQTIENEHAKTRAYTETLIGDLRHEMTIRFEHVDHNLELLAESVVGVHQRIDRETAEIRTEMRDGFAHVHSMMKSMYGEAQ